MCALYLNEQWLKYLEREIPERAETSSTQEEAGGVMCGTARSTHHPWGLVSGFLI